MHHLIRCTCLLLYVSFLSCREHEATYTFASLEREFERYAMDKRGQISDKVAYNFVSKPKFRREIMGGYNDYALQAARYCDSFEMYIDSVKTVLKKQCDNGKSSVTLLEHEERSQIKKLISSTLNKMLATVGGHPKDSAEIRTAIIKKHPDTFDDSTGWADRHLEGSCARAQMELSRFKADMSDALLSIEECIINHSNEGCSFQFARQRVFAIPMTSYAVSGEDVEARIIWATTPDTNENKLVSMVVNGQKLKTIDGIGAYTTEASGMGIKVNNGEVRWLSLNDNAIHVEPLRFDYCVMPHVTSIETPNSRVLYVGENNPIIVSSAMVFTNEIFVTANGKTLTGNNGEFSFKPTDTGNVMIKVYHRKISGQSVALDSVRFRLVRRNRE
jgi:hypothetical protein